MTKQEIKDLVAAKLVGQGNQVDLGSALPAILDGIVDLVSAEAEKAVKQIGNLQQLATTAKDNLVNAVNEIADNSDGAQAFHLTGMPDERTATIQGLEDTTGISEQVLRDIVAGKYSLFVLPEYPNVVPLMYAREDGNGITVVFGYQWYDDEGWKCYINWYQDQVQVTVREV